MAKGFSFSTLGAKHSNHMLGWKSLSHLLYGGIGQGLNVSGASSNPVSRQNFHADKGRLKIWYRYCKLCWFSFGNFLACSASSCQIRLVLASPPANNCPSWDN